MAVIFRLLAASALALSLPLAAQAQPFNTFLGGTNAEHAYGVAVHPNGMIYVVGDAISPGLGKTSGAPVLNASLLTPGSNDGFVARFQPSGTLDFFTYLGNTAWSASISSIAVNSQGKLVIAGSSGSIPTGATPPTPPGTIHGHTDAFIALVDQAGTACTFQPLGGAQNERALGVAVLRNPGSPLGDTYYVCGWTSSVDFGDPALNNSSASCAGCGVGPSIEDYGDAFVAKLDGQLKVLKWTYLGGKDGNTFAKGIALGPNGSVYVTGLTTASGLATANRGFPAGMTKSMGSDAFVARFDKNLNTLEFFCYLGGDGDEGGVGELHASPAGIAVDAKGSIYVTGETRSRSPRDAGPSEKPFPVVNAIPKSETPGPYVVKLKPDNDPPSTPPRYRLAFSTCLGTHVPSADGRGLVLHPDSHGAPHVWVTGMTSDTPAPDAALVVKNGLPSRPTENAYLVELSQLGLLEFATCLPGVCPDPSAHIRPMALAFATKDQPVIVGATSCSAFPPSPVVSPFAGDLDAFVWARPVQVKVKGKHVQAGEPAKPR